MSRDFPDWLNPWSAAQGRKTHRGSLPLVRLERLAAELENAAGEAEFELTFALDSEQRPVLELTVRAGLPLLCQASLTPFVLPVERKTTLAVVNSLEEAAELPGHYEPVVAEHNRIEIRLLVEDELLLSLPAVPRRPDLDPVHLEVGSESAPDADDEGRQHPFAGLGDLLQARSRK